MSSDSRTKSLAAQLADPYTRAVWSEELWEAFADQALRDQFERETGFRPTVHTDPLHEFTDAGENERYAYIRQFAMWFSERCWPSR